MEQTLDSSAEVDEGAVVDDRHDTSRKDGVGNDEPPNLLRPFLLLFLQERAPRDDQILAVPFVLDDSKAVDLSFMDRGVLGKTCVDLGNGTEGTLPGDSNLVPSFDRLLDTPLDRKSRLEGLVQ